MKLMCCARAQEISVQTTRLDCKVSTPQRFAVPDVGVRIYLKAWNARLVPYQSQKTVRTTLRVGRTLSGRLTLTRQAGDVNEIFLTFKKVFMNGFTNRKRERGLLHSYTLRLR